MEGALATLAAAHKRIVELLHKPATSWVVLACALALTFAAWYVSDRSVRREAEQRFQSRAEALRNTIAVRIGRYQQILVGGLALFQASESVGRGEFHRYVKTLRLEQTYPGIQGVGFSLRVRPGQLDQHVAAVRKEGFPDYRVWPEGQRDEYYPTVYLEPFEGRNPRAFGYDMHTEAVRRGALDLARDTGEASLTGIVRSVLETAEDPQRDFLMYLPVFANGQPVTTVEERRQALVGFVFSPFRVNDLMQGILGNSLESVRFRVYDGAAADRANLLYDSQDVIRGQASPGETPEYTQTLHTTHGGRAWTLEIDSLENSFAAEKAQPMVIATAGLTVDALLFCIVFSLRSVKKRATALAERMTKELRAVTETAHEAIVSAGADGKIVYANNSAYETFGYFPGELLGKTFEDLLPRGFPAIREVAEAARESGTQPEDRSAARLTALREQGSEFPVTVSLAAWDSEGQRFLTAIMRDVTQRQLIEQQKEELSKALENAVDGIARVDHAGNYVTVNPAYARMLGYEAGELVGQNWTRTVHPQDQPRMRQCYALSPGREHEDLDARAVCRDGTALDVHVVIVAVPHMLGTGSGYYCFQRDISDKKRAWILNQTNARLVSSNQDLEEFASAASHDMQEPLRKIQAFGDLLRESCAGKLDAESQDYLARMQDAAKRMRALLTDLLALSRVTRDAAQPVKVDLNVIASEVLLDLEVRVRELDASVQLEELPTVNADPTQMRQLFQNLIGNGLKFHRPGVSPKVSVSCSEISGGYRLAFRDDGIGFDEQYAEQIFAPFRRLHPRHEYEGTGLGLALCRRILERSGGSIEARAKAGMGATFVVTLPSCEDTAAVDEEAFHAH